MIQYSACSATLPVAVATLRGKPNSECRIAYFWYRSRLLVAHASQKPILTKSTCRPTSGPVIPGLQRKYMRDDIKEYDGLFSDCLSIL